ncbi:type II toxin-antitoxin system RelE/ParE family toxin [Rhizobium sp. LjRoot254]|uniref:type II toxin-antitoxin system RelE/ParE family toxin n=1 Tax=Rhizobium sp. LjRoot254 TaxID=3342297 RepID=UPI003ECE9D74
MGNELERIPLLFWRSSSGNEPVRDWLNELPRDDQRVVGRDLAKLQYGWPIGMPICRSLGSGLWEVRSSLPSRREARVVITFRQGKLIALSAFIKKTQATPKAELQLALERLKALKNDK